MPEPADVEDRTVALRTLQMKAQISSVMSSWLTMAPLSAAEVPWLVSGSPACTKFDSLLRFLVWNRSGSAVPCLHRRDARQIFKLVISFTCVESQLWESICVDNCVFVKSRNEGVALSVTGDRQLFCHRCIYVGERTVLPWQ